MPTDDGASFETAGSAGLLRMTRGLDAPYRVMLRSGPKGRVSKHAPAHPSCGVKSIRLSNLMSPFSFLTML